MIRGFEQGPFPAVDVEPWPAAFVQLFERSTGRTFDPALFAAYERVRSYLGHEGIKDSPRLEGARARTDNVTARQDVPPTEAPKSERTGVERAAPGVIRQRVADTTKRSRGEPPVSGSPAGAFLLDPNDLGD